MMSDALIVDTRPRGRLALRISAPSAILVLALFVGLMAQANPLLGDPDTQWHIAVGRWIWAAAGVPSTDLFSHTFQGSPWIAKEWLSQLVLFAAHAAADWTGVVVVASLSIAVSFGILHEWLRARVSPTAALAFTLVAIMLGVPHFLARPHILVLPIIVLWMASLVSALERDRAPSLACVLLMALWANMHGSFPLGLVLAGILALEGIVAAPPARRLTRLRGWAVFGAASLAATMLSPYGWHAILVPLKMHGNAETLRYVNEWQPLRLDVIGCVALASLVAALLALIGEARRNLFRIAAMALLAYLMIRHSRFISLFAIMTPLLVARAVSRRPALAARTISADPPMLWGIAGALAAACVVSATIITPRTAASVTPDAAYDAALAHGVAGPVYNDYDFGGYLIAHGVKTFVDGRTDQLFLDPFLPALARAITNKDHTDFAALLTRYHVTWAIVRASSRDAAHLAALPGWTRIHADKVAEVFVATSSSAKRGRGTARSAVEGAAAASAQIVWEPADLGRDR